MVERPQRLVRWDVVPVVWQCECCVECCLYVDFKWALRIISIGLNWQVKFDRYLWQLFMLYAHCPSRQANYFEPSTMVFCQRMAQNIFSLLPVRKRQLLEN